MEHLLQWLVDTGGRHAVKIVHHIPGRIRLRATAALQPLLSGNNGQELQKLLKTLATVTGIQDVTFNPLTASLVVQYDARHIPFHSWEDLFQDTDATASQVTRSLLHISNTQ